MTNRERINILKTVDSEVYEAIQQETKRQQDNIELIASENIVSEAVLAAAGSVLTNKYAEGYPAKRYYGGCQCVDIVENIARERCKQLFGCDHANVQPHSGSSANIAVYFALLKPGDTVRHFKGNLYQVLYFARDSETREDVVVYRALYGEHGVWVRPKAMFMSEVDREKYPDAAQTYRFERVGENTHV